MKNYKFWNILGHACVVLALTNWAAGLLVIGWDAAALFLLDLKVIPLWWVSWFAGVGILCAICAQLWYRAACDCIIDAVIESLIETVDVSVWSVEIERKGSTIFEG